MDLPLHIVTGAVIGNALLYHEVTRRKIDFTRTERVKLATAAFLIGVVSHLFWDWMPHYDWLFSVELFKPLPLHWLIPQILTTLPVILVNLYLNRDAWPLAAIAMFGGMYPDVEKLCYFDFNLPRFLIMFRQHSCYLTQWRPWELAHKQFLVVFEIVAFLILLAVMYALTQARRRQRVFPTFPIFCSGRFNAQGARNEGAL